MARARAAAALLLCAAYWTCSAAAPAIEQTGLDLYDDGAKDGCYYNFQHYGEGDRIMTNEPCLNCTCHNRMLMCYLRVCPFTKPIGQDCTVEKRGDQCCPVITCPDVPVNLLTSTSTTSPAEYASGEVGHLDKYGCSIEGRFFPEGSKVPPNPNKPCELCYCIRNMTTCVMQECTLHVDGCTPVYQKDACCPVRYSCDHPEDEIPMLDDMTTTIRPTPGFLLTTTTAPGVTQDCIHQDETFPDGALIKTEKACEHCYCMKGDIVCVVQECGTPMENEGKNCTSLPPREGQCCPDTYICEGDIIEEGPDSELSTTYAPLQRTTTAGTDIDTGEDQFNSPATSVAPILEDEGSGIRPTEESEPSSADKITIAQTTDNVITEEIPSTTSRLVTRPEEDAISPTASSEQDQEKPPKDESPSTNSPVQSEIPLEPIDQVTEQATYISSESPKPVEIHAGISEPSVLTPESTKPPTETSHQKESAPKVEKGPEELQQTAELPEVEPEIKPHGIDVEHEHLVSQVTEQTTEIIPESYTNRQTPSEIIPALPTEQTTDIIPESYTQGVEESKRQTPSEIIPTLPAEQTTPQYIQYTIEAELSEQTIDATGESTSETPSKDYSDSPQTEKSTATPENVEEITKVSLDSTTASYSIDENNTVNLIDEVNTQSTEHTNTDYEKSTSHSQEDVTIAANDITLSTEASPSEDLEGSGEYTNDSLSDSAQSDQLGTTPKIYASETKPDDSSEKETLETTINPYTEIEYSYSTKSPQDGLIPGLTDHSVENVTYQENTDIIPSTTVLTEQEVTHDIQIESTTNNVYDIESAGTYAQGPSDDYQPTLQGTSPTEKSTIISQEFDTTTVLVETSKNEDESSVLAAAASTVQPISDFSVNEPSSSNIPEETEEHKTTLGPYGAKDELVPEIGPTENPDVSSELSSTTDLSITTQEPESQNEVEEEPILPHIPGEGDCLVEGITYTNDSQVPSTNKCQRSCKCFSSIVKCEQIQCSPPPQNMMNCQPIYDLKESCCPTYVCDHTKETSAPESHNQMLDITTEVSKIYEEITMKPIDETADQECRSGECTVKEPAIEPVNVPDLCNSESCSNAQDESENPDVYKKPQDEHSGLMLDVPVVLDCSGETCPPATKDTSPILPLNEVNVLATESPISQCSGEECKIGPNLQPASDDTKNPDSHNKVDEIMKPDQLPEVPVIVSLDCAGESCPSTTETTMLTASTTIPVLESATDQSISPCSSDDCSIVSSHSQPSQQDCNDEDCIKKEKPILAEIPNEAMCKGEECKLPPHIKPTDISTDVTVTSEDCTGDKCGQPPLPGPEQSTPVCKGEQCVLPPKSKPVDHIPTDVTTPSQDCKSDSCGEPAISGPEQSIPECDGDQCALLPQGKPLDNIPTDVTTTSEDCKSDSCGHPPLSGPEPSTSECIGDQCAPIGDNFAQSPTVSTQDIDIQTVDKELLPSTATPCSAEECSGSEHLNDNCFGSDCAAVSPVPDTSCAGDNCENSRPVIPQDSSSACEEENCNSPPAQIPSCEGDKCDNHSTEITSQKPIISCIGEQCQHPTAELPTSKPLDENKDSIPEMEPCRGEECKKPIDISPQIVEHCNNDNCGKLPNIEVPVIVSPGPSNEGSEGDCSEEGCKKPADDREKPIDDESNEAKIEYIPTSPAADILPTETTEDLVTASEGHNYSKDGTLSAENDQNKTFDTSQPTDIIETHTTPTINEGNASERPSDETYKKPHDESEHTQHRDEDSANESIHMSEQPDRSPSTQTEENKITTSHPTIYPFAETQEVSTNKIPEAITTSEEAEKHTENAVSELTTTLPVGEYTEKHTESALTEGTTFIPLAEQDDKQTDLSQETEQTNRVEDGERQTENTFFQGTATPSVEDSEYQSVTKFDEGTTQRSEISWSTTADTLPPKSAVEIGTVTPAVIDEETNVKTTTVSSGKQEKVELTSGSSMILEPETSTLSNKEQPPTEYHTTESIVYIQPAEVTSIAQDQTPLAHITEGPLMNDEKPEKPIVLDESPLDQTTNITELANESDEVTPIEVVKLTEAPISQTYAGEQTTKAPLFEYTQEEVGAESPQTKAPIKSDIQPTKRPEEPLVTEKETMPDSHEITAGITTTSELPSELDQRISEGESGDKRITTVSPDTSAPFVSEDHEATTTERSQTSSSEIVSDYTTTYKPLHVEPSPASVIESNEVEQPEQPQQQTEKAEPMQSQEEAYITVPPMYSETEISVDAALDIGSDTKHTIDQPTENIPQNISVDFTSEHPIEISTIGSELLNTESPISSTENLDGFPQSSIEPSNQAENTIPSEHTTAKYDELPETEETAIITNDSLNNVAATSALPTSKFEQKTTIGLPSLESQEKGTTQASISESPETEILYTNLPSPTTNEIPPINEVIPTVIPSVESPEDASTQAEVLATASVPQETENEVYITTTVQAIEANEPTETQSQTEYESRPATESPHTVTVGDLAISPAVEETQKTTLGPDSYFTSISEVVTKDDTTIIDTQSEPEKESPLQTDEVQLQQATTVADMPSEEMTTSPPELISYSVPEEEPVKQVITTDDETKVSQKPSMTEVTSSFTNRPELSSDENVQTQQPIAEQSPEQLPDASVGSDDLPSPQEDIEHQSPQLPSGYPPMDNDYEQEEDQNFGPGTCRYGGKVYVSAQQIPRDDPCDFCFCFRSDIICLQQSCPPPIHGCHEEPISGFCCPRYECPVAMATTLNVTTTTTTTTTTLPPHFLPHAYKGAAQRRGCYIKGHTYKVGEVVRSSSGPCLHCTCGGDGQMKCDPKVCTPEPMLRQMIAAAVSTKRRR